MSRLTEIQKQYRVYVAASEAVKKTDPGTVEVVYKEECNGHEDGFFIYDPVKDRITIHPRRCMSGDYVNIDVDDIPAFIKALREFAE